MRTVSLMLTTSRLNLGEFDPFPDDIADLAPDGLQHPGERRPQGLLHLHDLEREDRRAFFQRLALLRKQRNDRARQWRYDLVFADLLFAFTAEGIDPVQFEAAVAGAHIQFMAFDDRYDARRHAVERQLESVVFDRRHRECEF